MSPRQPEGFLLLIFILLLLVFLILILILILILQARTPASGLKQDYD